MRFDRGEARFPSPVANMLRTRARFRQVDLFESRAAQRRPSATSSSALFQDYWQIM